jgi:2-hydroxychromene-2-carboxylate isomerase
MGSEAGLRLAAERAGLPWEEARRRLGNEDWRDEIEANRLAMTGLGLWGVPSFRLRGPEGAPDFVTWGQDRLWLIEHHILHRLTQPPRTGPELIS